MTLPVTYAGRVVGAVDRDGERFAFRYAPEWLAASDAFPVSLSLPLRAEAFADAAADAFFANLLPEGNVRVLTARRLGISIDNDYALLAAIGGECAGALAVGDAPDVDDYRPLSDDELDRYNTRDDALPSVSGRDGVRLSLAGAQDKLPVRVDGDRVSVPRGAAASTHIIKFASRDYSHMPANESLVTAVARALGLRACDAHLRPLPSSPVLVVARYDRVRDDDGGVVRLHQEDLCQALGISPRRKYQDEGGPSFADCYRLVVDHSADPLTDGRALLEWLAFNVVVGNADGHAKNLSLLRTPGGGLRLAPFYDLLCTAAYPGITRRLAMRVGDASEPGAIRDADWRALAAAIGVRPAFVVDLVADVAARVEPVAREVADDGDAGPAAQMVLPCIRKLARRTREQLGRRA